jgi:nucleoside-diphosphate-sugar epimerase
MNSSTRWAGRIDSDEDRKRVVVLGASGFIGSVVFQRLRDAGYGQVIGHSSSTCDLLSPQSVTQAFKDADQNTTVVMCAGVTTWPDVTSESVERSVGMIQNFLQALPLAGIRNLIFLSSMDVYGRQGHVRPINEQTPLRPEGDYGRSKVLIEQILTTSRDKTGPVTILRPSQIYGHTDGGKTVVGSFVRKVIADEELEIVGDGTNTADFVAVSDIANVVLNFVRRPHDEIVNVATGSSHSILQLVSLIGDAVGKSPRTRLNPESGPGPTLEFDVSKMNRICPDVLITPLKRGVQNYVSAATSELPDRG